LTEFKGRLVAKGKLEAVDGLLGEIVGIALAKGLHSALRLKDYRLRKGNRNGDLWPRLAATPQYQAGRRERYKIERKCGEAK
jgi:hypothetical protein